MNWPSAVLPSDSVKCCVTSVAPARPVDSRTPYVSRYKSPAGEVVSSGSTVALRPTISIAATFATAAGAVGVGAGVDELHALEAWIAAIVRAQATRRGVMAASGAHDSAEPGGA